MLFRMKVALSETSFIHMCLNSVLHVEQWVNTFIHVNNIWNTWKCIGTFFVHSDQTLLLELSEMELGMLNIL